jgi:hypothetical protein
MDGLMSNIQRAVLFLTLGAIGALIYFSATSTQGDKDRPSSTSASDSTPVPISSPVSSENTASSNNSDSYKPSDEIIDVYKISKNPFILKGHSGILDTIHIPLVRSDGFRTPMSLPGANLRFEKMLDEHTAVYAVVVVDESITTDGEIAVYLPDSTPPESTRPWRVYVDGPLQATNGFGAPMQVTVVRFEGYYVPQSNPTTATVTVPPPASDSATAADTGPAQTNLQTPATSTDPSKTPDGRPKDAAVDAQPQ